MNFMPWQSASLLLVLASIFLFSLFGSIIAAKLHKSSIVFYILMGLFTSQLVFQNESTKALVEPLSSLGIVLLLFTIGLELPLQRLLRSGKTLFFGALMQVLATAIILVLPFWFWTKSIPVSMLLALAFSMSSTAVVGKLLQQKGEDSSLSGEISLGILIFQDLVSVALITLITFFNTPEIDNSQIGLLFFGKALAVGLLFGLLTKLINFVFDQLKLNREELALFTFALLFLVVGLFSMFGIPETTAGFLIGVLLAGRREQHEIFSQVRVFRDVLLVLFFFFLGTYLVQFNLGWLLLSFFAAIFIMLVKFLVLWLIYVVMGLHQKTAFWVGFDLMQVGEFAFVLLTLMAKGTLLNLMQAQILIMTIIWSLLLFNLIYRNKLKYYRLLDHYLIRRFSFLQRFSSSLPKVKFDQIAISDHLVLCGYGRVGSYIGHGLILSQLPLIVIDTDADRIKRLLDRGARAIYGDATEPEILDYAQVEKAKLLIVTVPSAVEQEQIILEAKRLNPKIQILTRTHLSANLRHFKALGVWQVIQPEFEAAITLLKKVLKLYGFEKEEIKKRLQYLKMEHGVQT